MLSALFSPVRALAHHAFHTDRGAFEYTFKPVGNRPYGITLADNTLWVTLQTERILRLDAATLEILPGPATTPVGPKGIAHHDRLVIVADYSGDSVMAFNSTDASLVATVSAGKSPEAVAIGDGAAWVSNSGDNTVSRIGLPSLHLESVFELPSEGRDDPYLQGIAYERGYVWVSDVASHCVWRLDAATGEPAGRVPVIGNPAMIASDGDALWVAVQHDGLRDQIVKIAPETGSIAATVAARGMPFGVAVAGDSIFVTCIASSEVIEIDRRTAQVIGAPVRLGRFVSESPAGVVADASSVWIANYGGSVQKLTRRAIAGS